ncbi:hypothetical protein C6N75_08240, partial [Streptomyces solincola]
MSGGGADRGTPGPGGLFVGVGARRGVAAGEVLELLGEVLADAGLPPAGVVALATAEEKAGEPGIVAAAARLGVPLAARPARELARIAVPTPSPAALAALGTPSVAEAAALAAAGALGGPPEPELLVPRRVSGTGRVTCAVARGRSARLSAGGGGYTGG